MDKFPNLVKMKKVKEKKPVPDTSKSELLELTSEIVSAHVGSSDVASTDLPKLIEEVFSTLNKLATNGVEKPTEQKSWQQLVMEEHVGYYNKRYGTNYDFDEYYKLVTTEQIEVHYKWKELLGLEPQTQIPPNPQYNSEKFKKHGNEE